MSSIILYCLLTAVVALVAGFVVGKQLAGKARLDHEGEAQARAQQILRDAEEKGNRLRDEKIKQADERLEQSKNKFKTLRNEFDQESRRLKAELENELTQRRQGVVEQEQSIKMLTETTQRQLEQLQKKEADLERQREKNQTDTQQLRDKLESQAEKRRTDHEETMAELEEKQKEADEQLHSVQRQLETIANLTAAEAREQLVESLKNEAQIQASSFVKDTVAQAKLTATKDAKKIVLETIQRTASEHAIENCVSIFNIESDDVKGKIIGREGRNIRALEAATGVEIIVDDTPEAIIISGFDPVRREIARPLAALAGERRPHSPRPRGGDCGQNPQEYRGRNRGDW